MTHTGPLAQEFAEVRDFLTWHHGQVGACRVPGAPCSCTALPALSVIERRVQEMEKALAEIIFHDGGGEHGDLCRHRMAGRKHANCRPEITRIARAALPASGAGTDGQQEGEA